MNYDQASSFILNILNTDENHKDIDNKKYNCSNTVLESLHNGSQISINYPGYKSYRSKYGNYKYDYRVNIIKNGNVVPLSHVNIIVELYHKIRFCGLKKEEVFNALIELFKNGNITWRNYNLDYDETFATGDHTELISYVNQEMQKNIGKGFDNEGNQLNLTVEEIFASMKWIALQEDINYPISKGYEGRKMPLARYLETLWSTEEKGLLTQVITRAMNKQERPKPFDKYDYSVLKEIK